MAKHTEPVKSYNTRVYVWQRDQIPGYDLTHDELMRVFRKYFQAHTQWHMTGSKRAATDTRYWLSQIRTAAGVRRNVILDWITIVKNEPVKPGMFYRETTQKQLAVLQKHWFRKALTPESAVVFEINDEPEPNIPEVADDDYIPSNFGDTNGI